MDPEGLRDDCSVAKAVAPPRRPEADGSPGQARADADARSGLFRQREPPACVNTFGVGLTRQTLNAAGLPDSHRVPVA